MTLSTWHRNLPITLSLTLSLYACRNGVKVLEELPGRHVRHFCSERCQTNGTCSWYPLYLCYVLSYFDMLYFSKMFWSFFLCMAICSRKGRLYNIDSRCLFSLGHFRIASLHLHLGCVGHHHEMLLVLTSWLLASRCSGQICCLWWFMRRFFSMVPWSQSETSRVLCATHRLWPTLLEADREFRRIMAGFLCIEVPRKS